VFCVCSAVCVFSVVSSVVCVWVCICVLYAYTLCLLEYTVAQKIPVLFCLMAFTKAFCWCFVSVFKLVRVTDNAGVIPKCCF